MDLILSYITHCSALGQFRMMAGSEVIVAVPIFLESGFILRKDDTENGVLLHLKKFGSHQTDPLFIARRSSTAKIKLYVLLVLY